MLLIMMEIQVFILQLKEGTRKLFNICLNRNVRSLKTNKEKLLFTIAVMKQSRKSFTMLVLLKMDNMNNLKDKKQTAELTKLKEPSFHQALFPLKILFSTNFLEKDLLDKFFLFIKKMKKRNFMQ